MLQSQKVISFYMFDKKEGIFRKVYFKHWVGNAPGFTNDKKDAKKYLNKLHANEDVALLERVISPSAITLNIELEIWEG
ncbi:hypothetical protein [Carnobacterium maltaromaticum]|uniref:hypothetical protein n=1 Tax=Carnobacterium maltaromaticum TaxID=2751 RepID=UPI002152B9D0|nr:hypothetical protein [Carnobacterium maltaromaticum]